MFLILTLLASCSTPEVTQENTFQKIVVNPDVPNFGHYYVLKPVSDNIAGVVVLLPGLSQKSEDVITDTKLPQLAVENNLLVIAYSGILRLSADAYFNSHFNQVLEDAIEKFKLPRDKFVLGGFSNGGRIALRYAELCNEFPDKFPISPKGVFMADSPIDMFLSWELLEDIIKGNTSEIGVREAEFVKKVSEGFYGGTPTESPDTFNVLTPFRMNMETPGNEKYLSNVAVRAYHDIDVSWRIMNRRQPPQKDNFIATAELINTLREQGNNEAEFMQSFRTGYRKNGDRHPHSWSIIDDKECVEWILKLIK